MDDWVTDAEIDEMVAKATQTIPMPLGNGTDCHVPALGASFYVGKLAGMLRNYRDQLRAADSATPQHTVTEGKP